MGRQLFLHNYLPAHLASALVTGALLQFIFNIEPIPEDELDVAGKKKAARPRAVREAIASQGLWMAWAVTGVIYAVVIYSFWVFCAVDVWEARVDG